MGKLKVGVASANQMDSFLAGQNIARQAMKAGNIKKVDLVMAFCGGRHDHQRFFAGLQLILGERVPIIGGTCVGVITNDLLCYSSSPDDDNFPAALAVFEFSDSIVSRTFTIGDLDKDEENAGHALAQKYQIQPDDRVMFIIYDSVKEPPTPEHPPMMNSAAYMLSGMTGKKFISPIPIIGGGVLGDYDFNNTQQFCGSFVDSQRIVATLLSGDLHVHYTITNGCSLVNGVYYTITKADGPSVFELDGKPIVEFITEQFGNKGWQRQIPLKTLTLGVNQGDKFGEFHEDNYNNRLIVGPTPNRDGVMLLEADLRAGDEVQFMIRDNYEMILSAKQKTQLLIDKVKSEGKRPLFAFYVDCAGRTVFFSGTESEEAAEVQKILNENNIPLLGFYSGVEVAPVYTKVKSLDWTGVLAIITE
jgi:hypothetical protein